DGGNVATARDVFPSHGEHRAAALPHPSCDLVDDPERDPVVALGELHRSVLVDEARDHGVDVDQQGVDHPVGGGAGDVGDVVAGPTFREALLIEVVQVGQLAGVEIVQDLP